MAIAAPSLFLESPSRNLTVPLTFFTHEQNVCRRVRICFRTERQKRIRPDTGLGILYTSLQSIKMLQSIVDLCNLSYEGESWKEVETMFWVLSKIDQKKLIDRVWTAMDDPTKQTKVVLCEYNYTTKQSIEAGHPNIVDRLPNGVLVHDAMYRESFVALMNLSFCLNDKIVWYRRRKITREGLNDIHRMQVVLLFKEGAFPAPVEDDDDSLPPLIPAGFPNTPPRMGSPTRVCPGAPLAVRTNGGGISHYDLNDIRDYPPLPFDTAADVI